MKKLKPDKKPLEDISALTKVLFDITLHGYERRILEAIFVHKYKKITIRMPTRAGKSFTMSIAAVLYSVFNKNKKVGVTAANTDKTGPIMQEIATRFASNDAFDAIVMCDSSGLSKLERLRKEVSKRRITLKNGSEISIKSADLTQKEKGMGFMGWGFSGLVIVDETSLIPREAYAKLYRMLLEHPDTQIVEIGNPWHLDHFYDHHNDPGWHKIHVGWEECVKAGRFTHESVMDQKEEMSELEFKVMLEAEFPSELEFSVFSNEAIENSMIENEPQLITEHLIGVDVAKGGRDFTVFTDFGRSGNNFYYVNHLQLDERDPTKVVGRLKEFVNQYGKDVCKITVDGIGNDVGAMMRTDQYHCRDFIAGHSPRSKKYYNKKTEAAFGIAKLMKNGHVFNIPKDSKYPVELRSWIYEVRSDEKQKLIDPAKSPDYGDSLLYALSDEIYHDTPRFVGMENVYKRPVGRPVQKKNTSLFRSKKRKR